MPLKQTRDLIAKYGEALKNGSISDQMLDNLLAPDTFKRSPGTSYIDPQAPISESNYSQMDGIKDFVQTLSEELDLDTLHQLTARIITRAPDRGVNTFMRNSTLEKALLAFELRLNPELAETHFDLPRIKEAFSGTNDIKNLQNVILNPLITSFKPAVDYLIAKKKVESLIALDPSSAKNQQAAKVLAQIKLMKKEDKYATTELTSHLSDTASLLYGNMYPADYRAKAEKVQGQPSLGMKILGSLMITLGVIAAAACIAFSSGIAAIPTALAVSDALVLSATGLSGAGLIAAGIGVFSSGMRKGLSQAMHQLADATINDEKEIALN